MHVPCAGAPQDLAVFQLQDAAFLNGYCALCVGFLYKEPVMGDWCLGIMSEAAHGRTANDNVDEFQRFLAAHPPKPPGPPRDPPQPVAVETQQEFVPVASTLE